MQKRAQKTLPPPDPIIPKAAVGRLSLYLRQLELFQKKGRATVSSRQLGKVLGVTDAQVRKDLAYFGQFGQPGIGYQVAPLAAAIRRILGTDHEWPVALVGVGNLGRALLGYRGFREHGFRFAALFDADPAKIGQRFEHMPVHPPADLSRVLARRKIMLAVLAVPAAAAQEAADRLIEAGIQGILNFAPCTLAVPPSVWLVNVDLAVQLEKLTFLVVNRAGAPERA